MVSSVLSATVLSSVLSSILACVITIFLMRNAKLLEDKQCVVSRATPDSRRNARANNSCCGAKDDSFLSRRSKPKLVLLGDHAVQNGAVCLDGSPPGYFIKRGYGHGVDSWIIHFNGGAWCYDNQACYQRSQTEYGSTLYVNNNLPAQGMYSGSSNMNPDFYNWNVAFVLYCDGASFTGNRANPVYFKDKAIYFRGKIILESIIDDLLRRGVRKSKQVILTGSSAGSLAVLIHADYITSRLPPTVKIRAIADGGFFVDLVTRYGAYKLREHFRSVVETHDATFGLHPACVRRTPSMEHWKCMSPEYFFDLIQTKVFILQAAYDVWQIINHLAVVCKIPNYHDLATFNTIASRDTRGNSTAVHARGARAWRKKHETLGDKRVLSNELLTSFEEFKENSVKWHWQSLYSSPTECTRAEIEEILSIYGATLKALRPVLGKEGSGLFMSPCFDHTQARYDLVWNNVKIKGKTMREAIHEWYFGKSENNFHIGKQLSFASCVP